jgi:hypothetical protein
VGTVQVVFAAPPNQPHRADVAKLLVHRNARRPRCRAAPDGACGGGGARGGQDAARPGHRHGRRPPSVSTRGWAGRASVVIPNFALYPDGRPCDTTVFWKAV